MMFLPQFWEAANELTPSASDPRVKKRCIKRDKEAVMTAYTKTTSQ